MSTLTTPLAISCPDFAAVESAWRMLSHVPDDAFVPVELRLDGAPLYTVVRDPATGNQTTISPCSN